MYDATLYQFSAQWGHGGFLYYEVLEIIQALAIRSKGDIVGMDLVEVAPAYDLAGCYLNSGGSTIDE